MQTTADLYVELKEVISKLNVSSISEERQQVLQKLIDFVKSKSDNQQEVRLNFICTHNSRRSHLSQVWAQTMAHYFEVKNVACYSGGTESTALFPMVAETLQRSGFHVRIFSPGDNPIYSIKYAPNASPIIGFSKKWDDDFNPQADFAAIMTCSQADDDCPFIPGAEQRIPLTFDDPKVFDHTPQQAEKYMERSMQIATEMCYVFSHV